MNILKLITKPAYAQDPIGTFEPPASIVRDPSQITAFFTVVVNILVAVAGLWFLFQLLLGGVSYITGAGDPKKTGEAMKKVTDSVIGLVIVAAAFIIANIAATLFFGAGFNIFQPVIQTIN